MRRHALQQIGLTLLLGVLLGWTWSAHNAQDVSAQKRDVVITRMYTGADGMTHFEDTSLPPNNAAMMRVAGVRFRRSAGPQKSGGPEAPGFTFHNGPHKRYVVTLSGKAEIEGSSGERFIADTNHILLVEDLTGKGHRYVSHPLGDEDWVVMFVEIDEPKPAAAPTN